MGFQEEKTWFVSLMAVSGILLSANRRDCKLFLTNIFLAALGRRICANWEMPFP
jgi:hypothetical protein